MPISVETYSKMSYSCFVKSRGDGMADMGVLKTPAFRRVGSIPTLGIVSWRRGGIGIHD